MHKDLPRGSSPFEKFEAFFNLFLSDGRGEGGPAKVRYVLGATRRAGLRGGGGAKELATKKGHRN